MVWESNEYAQNQPLFRVTRLIVQTQTLITLPLPNGPHILKFGFCLSWFGGQLNNPQCSDIVRDIAHHYDVATTTTRIRILTRELINGDNVYNSRIFEWTSILNGPFNYTGDYQLPQSYVSNQGQINVDTGYGMTSFDAFNVFISTV